MYTSVTYARRIVPPLHSSVRPRARTQRIRERKRARGRGEELVERVSEWLGGCLSDGGEGEGGRGEDRWTGKKNTVANQTENTFSLFLYLFRVNICSGNIRSFRFVSFRSISSTGLSVPFCSHPERAPPASMRMREHARRCVFYHWYRSNDTSREKLINLFFFSPTFPARLSRRQACRLE